MSEETIPYFQRMQMIKLGMLPKEAVAKPKKPIPKKSAKKIAEEKNERLMPDAQKNEKIALGLWFKKIQDKHFNSNGGKCMECGEWIPLNYARHATAHLLPKKLFKSVATHPLNYLILGASCGCHEKSHRIDKFIQLNCWQEAANRIKIMMPLLPFDELRHISNQLLIALDDEQNK